MKRKIIIVALLILVGAAIYFWMNPNNESGFKEDSRDFAVHNIEAVDEITIVDQEDSVTLIKQGESWKVNGYFLARPDLIKNLLSTINKVKVRNRIAKEGLQQINTLMKAHHKTIYIYANDELIKTYWVGGKTMDSRGTYMLLQNKENEKNPIPFVTHIEGFEGFLSERYVTKVDLWRDTHIFYNPENSPRLIKVEYPLNKAESFSITIKGNDIELIDGSGNAVEKVNLAAVKTYILNYKEVVAESYITKENKSKLDSLKKLVPDFIITMEDQEGHSSSVKGFKRKTLPDEVNYLGQHTEFDVDRLYGITMGDQQLCMMQYYIFDRLTKKLSDFKSL